MRVKNLSYINVDGVYSLYLIIDKINRYIEENNEDKYFMLVLTNKSKEKKEIKKKTVE